MKNGPLRCVRGTEDFFRSSTLNLPGSYPRPLGRAYSARVLFEEGPLSRSDPEVGQRRELAGPGRPGAADSLVTKVERREAQRPTSLGARGRLAARGGYVIPASKGCVAHTPGASRRSTPSRRSREGLAKLGRIAPRE